MKKILDILDALCRPKDVTADFTVTKGVLSQAYMKKVGRIVLLQIVVKNTSATAVGQNVFEANLATERPLITTNGCGYYGSTATLLQLTTAGNASVRVLGNQLAANAEVFIGICYIA